VDGKPGDVVALKLDLEAAIETLEAVTDDAGMALEPSGPRRVTKPGELVGGFHEVGEQDRREHPICAGGGRRRPHKFSQLRGALASADPVEHEVVDRGVVTEESLADLRVYDHLVNYFYLPAIAEA
jgi:hypothetical protein